MYAYHQELYFRAVWFVRNRLNYNTQTIQPEGRTYPTVPRQDEEYILPKLSRSNDWLAYLTLLLCTNETNDYAIAKVFAHVNTLAQRSEYVGNWEIWKKLIRKFGIGLFRATEKESTVFSLPDYFEFLEENFHTDEIFGNILKRSVSLAKVVKIRKINYSVTTDNSPVVYPIRHRGYRDKGSLAPVGSKEYRKANQSFESKPKLPKEDFLGEVVVWGLPPLENN